MDMPTEKLSRDEFNRFFARYKAIHYRRCATGYVCKKCGADILEVDAEASIHYADFNNKCSDSGETQSFGLPFCPTCEGVPERTRTCVHLQEFPPGTVFNWQVFLERRRSEELFRKNWSRHLTDVSHLHRHRLDSRHYDLEHCPPQLVLFGSQTPSNFRRGLSTTILIFSVTS